MADNDINNIYTVHDCFAVSADNVAYLIKTIKAVYMKIYSEVYLKKVHEYIITSIKSEYGDNVFSEDGKRIEYVENDSINQSTPFPSIDD